MQERLRSLVAERLVNSVVREWREEGIQGGGAIESPDASGVLELLHRPATGIFSLVDAASLIQQDATGALIGGDADAALVGRMQQLAAATTSGGRSASFALAGPTTAYRRSDLDFVIRHSFGSVVYTASGFDSANRVGVSAGLADILRNSSTDAFVALLFSGEQSSNASAATVASPTVSQRWMADLEAICDRLTTSPGLHFVHCIKVRRCRVNRTSTNANVLCLPLQPAMVARPGVFDGAYVLAQLQAAGVPAVLSVYGVGWVRSLSHADFLFRFRLWLPKRAAGGAISRSRDRVQLVAARFCGSVGPLQTRVDPERWGVGVSRVYFKQGALELLEARLEADELKAQARVQRFMVFALKRLRKRVSERAVEAQAVRGSSVASLTYF